MKNLKKNDALLITSTQSCGYLLMLTNKSNVPVNAIQKKQFKKMVNSEIAALKKDIRKLKRV
jgi:hypothetical protein